MRIIDKIRLLLALPLLIIRAKRKWLTAGNDLPGKAFFTFGRSLAFKLLSSGKISPKLLLNPVSIVRYFEFAFVESLINTEERYRVLDIASPYLMTFKLLHDHNIDIQYINPDTNDLRDVAAKSKSLPLKGSLKCLNMNALDLVSREDRFDTIFSISVIEHVANNQDGEFISAAWKVLKPGGLLILTFPVKAVFEEEFIDKDVYGLNNEKKKDKFFFQRYYDEQSIKERLLNQLSNFEIISQRVFGETSKNFYHEYHKRWNAKGYFETINDPIYIANHFKDYQSISELPGLGILGIAIKKKK
ncbi:MAG: class I SAM-dependent methyltransferase [Bacteroidota bacterium]